MGDRKIPHVEDIFSNQDNVKVKHRVNEIEQKNSIFSFKNKQAPAPPDGYAPLPKIGNYQPKILLRQTSSEYSHVVENGDANFRGHSAQQTSARQEMIIGDKDIPLVIGNKNSEDYDQPMAPPRRKRRAPVAPGESEITSGSRSNSIYGRSISERSDQEHTSGSRSNSFYGRTLSERSDEEPFEMDMETHGGDIDFGPGIDNPSFRNRDSALIEHHKRTSASQPHLNGGGKDFPYIPAPDYDDEEMTMSFGDEREFSDYNKNNKRMSVYKEYEGDDYGVYLQDEEDFDRNAHSLPRGGKLSKSKSAPRPPSRHNKQDNRFSKPKHSKDTGNKKNTIRDFTFSDSKMGWGDRSVKSTSAKGRYIKREKEKDRRRINKHDAFDPSPKTPTPGSYEEFLQVSNNIPMESPNSSDSGVEMGMEKAQRDMYYHSQPKQMRNSKYDNKPSLWRRLTWRFKKSVDLSRIEYR